MKQLKKDYEAYASIPGKVEEEWLKCVNSFAYFAMKYSRIIHPIDGLVRFVIYTSLDDKLFQECWALSNLQPLEKIANVKKGNRL